MHPAALSFAALLLASTLVVDRGEWISTNAARPIVLIVHGRGQLGLDSAEIRRDALHALQVGAFRATGDSLFREQDVRLVWYADVLDSRWNGDNASRCQSIGRPTLASPDTVKTALNFLASIAGAIVELATEQKASADDVHELRGIVGDLRYISDSDTRCAAEGRVGKSIEQARSEGRPIILVAHSLGALVSWGALRQSELSGAKGPVVERFVTLGSPLGSPDVRRLVFGDDASSLTVPKSVKAWVNVIDVDDPFAIRLLRTAADSGIGLAVRDVATTVPHADAHKMSEYLRDPATASEIVSAWRSLSR